MKPMVKPSDLPVPAYWIAFYYCGTADAQSSPQRSGGRSQIIGQPGRAGPSASYRRQRARSSYSFSRASSSAKNLSMQNPNNMIKDSSNQSKRGRPSAIGLHRGPPGARLPPPLSHLGGTSGRCVLRHKCTDPNCEKGHPNCNLGGACSNEKCGFVHPSGWRYTRPAEIIGISGGQDDGQQPSAAVRTCWKKEKCDDSVCKLSHPPCNRALKCSNPKCGFAHPDGRRYTGSAPRATARTTASPPAGRPQSAKTAIHRPTTTSAAPQNNGTLLPTRPPARGPQPVKAKFSVEEMLNIKDSMDKDSIHHCDGPDAAAVSDSRPVCSSPEAETVNAQGTISGISTNGLVASVRPFRHFFARNEDFHKAARKEDAQLDLSGGGAVEAALAPGDQVSVRLSLLPTGQLRATAPKLLKCKLGARRDAHQLSLLVTLALEQSDFQLLARIGDLHESLAPATWLDILRRFREVLCDRSRLHSARRLQRELIQSGLLAPWGGVCKRLGSGVPPLLPKEAALVRDILGAMVVLRPSDARLLAACANQTAPQLPDGAIFLGQMLLAACTPLQTDRMDMFAWWQLPSAPLEAEIGQAGTTGPSPTPRALDSLPAVRLGEPYPDEDSYLSTYMRLHRADCFLDVTQKIQQLRQQRAHGTASSGCLLLGSIVVCGLLVSDGEGALLMRLSCVVLDPRELRYNNLAVGNLISVSLSGTFRESSLLWGIVKAGPQPTERRACEAAGRALASGGPSAGVQVRVTLLVQWCTPVSSVSNREVVEGLRSSHPRSCAIENPVSFVTYAPVLAALQGMWQPGAAISFPFMDTLLRGHSAKAADRKAFREDCASRGLATGMDAFQRQAMAHVAKHSFALIQGPPGTGKSYLASRIARVLASVCGRVLVITAKNHALDEILAEILADIQELYGKDTNCFVRVGQQAKIAARLRQQGLHAVTQESAGASAAYGRRRQVTAQCHVARRRLADAIAFTGEIFLRATGDAGRRWLASWTGLPVSALGALDIEAATQADLLLGRWAGPAMRHLRRQLKSAAAEAAAVTLGSLDAEREAWRSGTDGAQAGGAEDDTPGLPDSFFGLLMHLGPGSDSMTPEQPGLWMNDSPPERRLAFVQAVLQHEVRARLDVNLELADQLEGVHEAAEAAQLADQAAALRKVPVIGATVLGALLHMEAISTAEPSALLLEEAAEVPEATLLSLLRMPSLRRCVMVGDHQQLRPNVNSYELRVHKHLDVSAFERLVLLGVPAPCLLTQNRMRPDVLAPVLLHYPKLKSNTDRVDSILPVQWLPKPLFWWVCEDAGERCDASWSNAEQANRAVKAAGLLVTQGAASAEKLTILVPYQSQLFLVRMLLRAANLTDVTSSTVDQYQGDENDIVILTLVRCNPEEPHKLGFMGEVNRMVVATSRQRRALLIIGSAVCFGAHPEWGRLLSALKASGSAGPELPLCCPRHPKRKWLSVPDSRCFPPSGCGEGCQAALPCGHTCSLRCHPQGQEHGLCKVPVQSTYRPCGHVLEHACHAKTDRCPKPVVLSLTCGHQAVITCADARKTAPRCRQPVQHRLSCGHDIWLPCGDDSDAYCGEALNACPSCVLSLLAPNESQVSGRSNAPEPLHLLETFATSSKSADQNLSAAQIIMVADAVAREGLCDVGETSILAEALEAAQVPAALARAALPSAQLWDHSATSEARAQANITYRAEQDLWRVVLAETGASVSREWMRQPLSLLAGVALAGVMQPGSLPLQQFSHHLAALHTSGIATADGLLAVMRQADSELYKALSDTSTAAGAVWYNSEEQQLATRITGRLAAMAETMAPSPVDEPMSSPKTGGGERKETAAGLAVFLQGWVGDSRCSLSVQDTSKRWGLTSGLDANCPPHCEVPRGHLYCRSLSGCKFVSIDLRSADFHILRLAVPELLGNSASWAAFVQSTLPELVAKVPFLPDMKPLRVRVLGKVLHKKNAALQSHCLRLITRVLLAMAAGQDLRLATLLASVDRVFRFSCDELCLQLQPGTGPHVAIGLALAVERCLSCLLGWEALLPVRVEAFELLLVPFSGRVQGMRRGADVAAEHQEPGGELLHAGHPALRQSRQFVDVPGVHQPAWTEHSLPPLERPERCSEGYFERRVISASPPGSSVEGVELKTLPTWARPVVLLEMLSRDAEIVSASCCQERDALTGAGGVETPPALSPSAAPFFPMPSGKSK